MTNCHNCRNLLREGARFCDECGRPATATSPEIKSQLLETPPTLQLNDPLIGVVLEDKYELLSRIGEGGMGTVYQARRIHIGDEVAIKMLHPRFLSDASRLERFRREARAAGALGHPNIVTIHDFVERTGQQISVFIVMELVLGESLRVILANEGSLQPSRALRLMGEVCGGIGSAHRRNILHRDIKPANIIVLPSQSVREVDSIKIVDFGLAKILDLDDTKLTLSGALLGTPLYMSPEQCEGKETSAQSDVYSLGVLLYEMLVGSPPFVADNITQLALMHLREAPPSLPSALELNPQIGVAVARALSKNPAERQSDAIAFWEELETANLGSTNVGENAHVEDSGRASLEDFEEKGVLDFSAEIEEAFDGLSSTLNTITTLNTNLGEKVAAHAHNMEAVAKGVAGAAALRRKIALLAASDMTLCARRLEAELPMFDREVSIVNDAFFGLVKLVKVTSEEEKEPLFAARLGIIDLANNSRTGADSIRGLSQAAAGLRGISKEVNQSSRRLSLALDGVVGKIEKVEHFASNAVAMLDELLADRSNNG